MKVAYYAVVLAVALTCGCSGVKFAAAPVNKQIPEAFTQRSVYPGGVAGYDFQDLVGNILFVETGKDPLRIDMIRPTGYLNAVIPIKDSSNFYRSRIQAGAEAQNFYLKKKEGLSSLVERSFLQQKEIPAESKIGGYYNE